MKIFNKKAFTLIEILVVTGIASVFIGTAILLLTNFRQGFSKSENTAILMQESALFIARLRTDLNNAVLSGDLQAVPVEKQLSASEKELQFQVYDNLEGKILPVTYFYRQQKNGGSLARIDGSGREKNLIKDHVASISWVVEIEKFSTPGSGTFRISINLSMDLKNNADREKTFSIKTSLFPARLNRQLNSL